MLDLSRAQRRAELVPMIWSNGRFYFDGRQISHQFLRMVLHFSNDLHGSVRMSVTTSLPRCAAGEGDCEERTNHLSDSKDQHRAKESIISFLEFSADFCRDVVPDNCEVHLPFFHNHRGYEFFSIQYSRLYNGDLSTETYFSRVWRSDCHNIKTRITKRVVRFAVCNELDRSLRDAVDTHKDAKGLKISNMKHWEWICFSELIIEKKRGKAMLFPTKYCSIIVDEADQSIFGLPHFMTKSKGEHKHAWGFVW